MAQINLKEQPAKEQVEQTKPSKHDRENLIGTLASVTVLGLFIIISWLGVWALFMIR